MARSWLQSVRPHLVEVCGRGKPNTVAVISSLLQAGAVEQHSVTAPSETVRVCRTCMYTYTAPRTPYTCNKSHTGPYRYGERGLGHGGGRVAGWYIRYPHTNQVPYLSKMFTTKYLVLDEALL